MSARKNSGGPPASPLVVGTIHSPAALRAALRLRAGEVDVLELRVDCFAEDAAELLRAAPRLRAPLIVTVRHPAEGGAEKLSFARREDLYAAFLPLAAYVDVELRSVKRLAATIAAARGAGARVIVSHHDFQRTPSGARLAAASEDSRRAGADIFKVAAHTSTAADVARLLALFPARAGALSVMGMGPLGKASRLLFARAGSVLNYGYLGEPQVTGQWPALLLKKRLAELAEPGAH